MKRKLFSLLFVLLALGTALGLRLMPRTPSYDECSDIYRRFADIDNVKATYICNKYINDTLRLDVTVLQALDSTGWNMLTEAFAINMEYVIEYDIPWEIWQPSRIDYTNRRDTVTANRDFVWASYETWTVTVFHIHSRDEKRAIIDNVFDYYFNNKKRKK